MPVIYYSNHNVYEIERTCEARDRYMLFEAYTKLTINQTSNKKTIDSKLISDL